MGLFKKNKEVDATKPPQICPLLSIATGVSGQFQNCVGPGCWWWNRKLEKCAVVHLAICLAQIAEMWGKQALKSLVEE